MPCRLIFHDKTSYKFWLLSNNSIPNLTIALLGPIAENGAKTRCLDNRLDILKLRVSSATRFVYTPLKYSSRLVGLGVTGSI